MSLPYGLAWSTATGFDCSAPKWSAEPDVEALRGIALGVLGLDSEADIRVTYFKEGAYNKVYTVATADQCYVLRVALPVDPNKVAGEVATMQFVRQKTTIPLPRVIAYENSNMNDLQFPWVFMEFIPDESLYAMWRGLSYESKKRMTIQLAKYQAQLYTAQLDAIGTLAETAESSSRSPSSQPTGVICTAAIAVYLLISLLVAGGASAVRFLLRNGQNDPSPRREVIIGSCHNQASQSYETLTHSAITPACVLAQGLITTVIAGIFAILHWSRSFIPVPIHTFKPDKLSSPRHWSDLDRGQSFGPFPNSYHWLRSRLHRVQTRTEMQIKRAIASEDADEDDVEILEDLLEAATTLLHHLPRVFPEDAVESTILFHNDLRAANILINGDGLIASILDWEHLSSAPLWLATQYPQLLIGARRTQEPRREAYGKAEAFYVAEPEVYGDLQGCSLLYWEAAEEYEKTLLRSVYTAEMERLVPGWAERQRATKFERLFEEQVAKLETGSTIPASHLGNWLAAYDGAGSLPGGDVMWPLVEEDTLVSEEEEEEDEEDYASSDEGVRSSDDEKTLVALDSKGAHDVSEDEAELEWDDEDRVALE